MNLSVLRSTTSATRELSTATLDLSDSLGLAGGQTDLLNGRLLSVGNVALTAARGIATFGAFAVQTLTDITQNAVKTAEELSKFALQTNLTIEEFQAIAFAASNVGVDESTLSKILADTEKNIGNFLANGGGPLKDFFEKVAPTIGVTADQFRKLNSREALQLYISSLDKANLSQSETLFYLEGLASNATLLTPLLKDGGKQFEQMSKRADELGLVLNKVDIQNLSDLGVVLNEVTSLFESAKDIVGATLAPFITDLGERFLATGISTEGLRDGVLSVIEYGVKFAGFFADVIYFIGKFNQAVEATKTTALLVVEQIGNAFGLGVNYLLLFEVQLFEGAVKLANKTLSTITDILNGFFPVIDDFVKEFDLFGKITKFIIDSAGPAGKLLANLFGDFIGNIGKDVTLFGDFKLKAPKIGGDKTEDVAGKSKEIFQQNIDSFKDQIKSGADEFIDVWSDVAKFELPSNFIEDWYDRIAGNQRKARDDLKKTKEEMENINQEGYMSSMQIMEKTDQASEESLADQISALKEFTQQSADSFAEQSTARKNFHKLTAGLSTIESAIAISELKKQDKTSEEHFKDQVSGFKNLTSVASQMFDEQSKERKKLHQLEQVFAGIELALSIKKQSANALTAITRAFEAPFPINFATGAAMIGIMSSLGVFGGSSSSARAPSAADNLSRITTGTVLGSSDPSESIKNAQEDYEDIALDQLAELRGIRNSLTALGNGISALAVSLVRTNGGVGIYDGPQGLVSGGGGAGIFGAIGKAFSSKRITVVDEGIEFFSQAFSDILDGALLDAKGFFEVETKKRSSFGLKKSTTYEIKHRDLDPDLQRQFTDIFSHIGSAVSEAAELLGARNIESLLGSFQIDLGKVSFKGLDGEEIEERLNAIFSNQADLIAEHVMPAIAQFQQIGEGAFETLTRVAKEQVIFNDALDRMGVSLSHLSNVMQIEVGQSLINFIGDAEKFSDLTNEFFEEFFTEDEKFAHLEKTLTETLATMDLTMLASRDEFRSLMETLAAGLDTEYGREQYAGLLELVPHFAEYFDQLEDRQLAELEEANRLAAEAEEELRRAREEEEKAARDLVRTLSDVASEMERVSKSALSGLKESVKVEQDILSERRDEQIDDINAGLDAKLATISANFEAQKQARQDQTAARVASMEKQIERANDRASVLSGLAQTLESSVSSLVQVSRRTARDNIQKALSAARRGGDLSRFSLDDSINTLTNIDESGFGSLLDLQLERSRTANELKELSELAGDQLSTAEKSIELMERQVEVIQAQGDRQLAGLDAAQKRAEDSARELADRNIEAVNAQYEEESAYLQSIIDNAESQLNALLGIETGVLSLADAQENFANSLSDLEIAIEDRERAIAAENELLASREREKADTEKTSPPAGIDEVFEPVGIGQHVSDLVKKQIENVRRQAEERQRLKEAEEETRRQYDLAVAKQRASATNLAEAFAPIAVSIGHAAVGNNNDLVKLTSQIAGATIKTNRLMERWDGDGQPEVRSAS